MNSNLFDLGWNSLYHGVVEPLPIPSYCKFAMLTAEPLTLSEYELIDKIADLTADKEGIRPILFSHTASQNFTSEPEPYYFCKTEDESLQISSQKLAIFMRATHEDSCEIPLEIVTYTTEKLCVKWSNSDVVNSFSALKKIHLQVPKPILNKVESAGIYHLTENFLTSGVLANYHLGNFKKQKSGTYYRLYWCATKQQISGYFLLGSFVLNNQSDII